MRIVIDRSSKAQLAAIFKKWKVVFAYLFGSQAKGQVGPLSDIDIAVCFDESVARGEHFDLRLEVLGELTDLFRTDDIDLVVLNDAPPLLAHRILKEGRLLFSANEKTRIEFETRAELEYLDWEAHLEKCTRQIFGSGAEHGPDRRMRHRHDPQADRGQDHQLNRGRQTQDEL